MASISQDEAISEPSTDPIPLRLLPDTAKIASSGRLEIGGVDVVDLTTEFSTPLFIYDEDHLRSRCQEAVSGFPGGAAYASKAFLCTAMAALADAEHMSIDVASGGELHIALAAGVSPDRLVMHGNNKSHAEIARALSLGVKLVVDSFDEIDKIEAVADQVRPEKPCPVLVRVTPGVEAHTHEFVRTGQEDSKFGFSLSSLAADEAVARLRRLNCVELVGVHAHIGSQIFRFDGYRAEVAAIVPFVVRHDLAEMCIGGGLGVSYLASEHAPSIPEWADAVHSVAREAGLPKSVKISSEPGRAIVASAAITCYTIGTIKDLPGIRTYVAVDGGMSDNPRPVLYGSGYEAFLPREVGSERLLSCRIVGKHCESGDFVIGDARLPSDVAVGDIVSTPVTGAYGYSMASHYNRLLRPAVVFVSKGNARVVCKRETLDDLLRFEV